MTLYHVHYTLADGTRGSFAVYRDSEALARLATANRLVDDGRQDFVLRHAVAFPPESHS